MNQLTKKSFFSISLGEKSSPEVSFSPKKQTVSYEVFKEHWKQALKIFNKSLVNDDDIQIVKNNLNQMLNLLLDELNHPNNYLSLKPLAFNSMSSTLKLPENTDYGPIWNYLFRNNIFEVVFLWSLSYPEYLFDLKLEQLKYYENLVYQMQTNEQTHLLLNYQIHRPLFALLNHCSTHNSEQIEKIMISILNQLCVCICKNSDLLEIFFQQAKMTSNQANNSNSSTFYLNDNDDSPNNPYKFTTHLSTNKQYMQPISSAKFFIFSLLIPYIHREGALGFTCGSLSLGQQARDALLMIMQLSMRNVNLAKYIVDNTDFCPILATGLSGLYSELPQKLESGENFEEIRYLKKEDILRIPSLNKFINSLEFCNNVIQVSHSLIANQLLQYVYYGFLVPVIAPALTQNCVDEIIAATAYLDLFLRTMIEPNLLKVFLKFILHAKFDEKITLLDTLISRINSDSKLSLITLMLFYTMIDFNSEEVIYRLILIYLMPCNHLMKSQILTLKQNSFENNGINADVFLKMATSYDKPVWLEPISKNVSNNIGLTSILNKKQPTPFVRWFQSLFEQNEMSNIANYLDGSQFNFIDYLKDAQQGILMATQSSLKWSAFYNTPSNTSENSDSSQTPFTKSENNIPGKAPSHELDYDAEEYLLNLNIFSTSMNDPIKSSRTTQNIFESNNDDVNDYDSMSHDYKRESSISSDAVRNDDELKKIKKKSRKSPRYKTDNLPEVKNSSVDKENCENLTVPKADAAKKRQRMRHRRRERANDFYFISFDNELSESDSSMTSENEELSKPTENRSNNNPEVIVNEAEEDGNLTGTSFSSSLTLNNETSSVSSALNQDDSESINLENRQQLIEYLFLNEENNKSFLNGNLTNFMDALDAFFAQNEKQFVFDKKANDLNSTCDHILGAYNQLFTTQSKSIESLSMLKYDDKNESQIDNPSSITHFPALANSTNSSTYSLNDNFDSGCVTDSSKGCTINDSNNTSKETDIGPFLMALFARLEHMLSNSLQINFLLTGILAKLAYFPQLILRVFLLNHNLVVQPNIKTLIQVLGNVKYKIDACSQSFNNFPLLYFKAKVCLVKRIVDSKPKEISNNNNSLQEAQVKPKSETKFRDIVRKKSTFDRFINFFKSEEPVVIFEKEEESKSNQIKEQRGENDISDSTQVYLTVSEKSNMPQVEYDLNDVKMMFSKNDSSKKTEAIGLQQVTTNHDDYSLLDNEWENTETRNIAYSAVVFDEFIKELAAICQEHSLTTHDF